MGNKITQVPVRVLYTGEEIPAIGMGTFGSDRFSAEDISAAVAGAIRCGYRLFDGASVYGNEKQIGEVYQAAFDEGVVERKELFIMSKVWNDMHGEGKVLESCRQTLTDLRLDYLDMYFVHWPFPNYHPPGCSIDSRSPDARPFSVDEFMQTWRQMEDLVDKGLTRYIGMSNMTIPKLEAVLPLCRIKPAMCEMELHPSCQQKALFDYCMNRKIQPVGFCPLGSPTRPERDIDPDDVVDMKMPALDEIAKAHGVHPAIVCLKWAVQRGQIPIPFSIYPNEYISNLKSVTEDPLTEKEQKIMAVLDRNCRFIKGHVFLWEGADDWYDLWDVLGDIQK